MLGVPEFHQSKAFTIAQPIPSSLSDPDGLKYTRVLPWKFLEVCPVMMLIIRVRAAQKACRCAWHAKTFSQVRSVPQS